MALSYCRLVSKFRIDRFQSLHRPFSSNLPNSNPPNPPNRVEEKPPMPVERTTYHMPQNPPRTERYTAMELFKTDYNLAINTLQILNRIEFSPYGLRSAWTEFQDFRLLRDQRLNKERAEFLGKIPKFSIHFIQLLLNFGKFLLELVKIWMKFNKID